MVQPRTRTSGPRCGPSRPGLTPAVTLAAPSSVQSTIVPIDQEVIDSEQEMADAFAANGLLPGKVDVADYFTDEFNDYVQEQAQKQAQKAGKA